jgi:hypothetical protein
MGGAPGGAKTEPSGPSKLVPVKRPAGLPEDEGAPPELEHPDTFDPMGESMGSKVRMQAPGYPQINPKIVLPKGGGARIKVPNLGNLSPVTTFGDLPGGVLPDPSGMVDPGGMVDPTTGMPEPPPSPDPEEEE